MLLACPVCPVFLPCCLWFAAGGPVPANDGQPSLLACSPFRIVVAGSKHMHGRGLHSITSLTPTRVSSRGFFIFVCASSDVVGRVLPHSRYVRVHSYNIYDTAVQQYLCLVLHFRLFGLGRYSDRDVSYSVPRTECLVFCCVFCFPSSPAVHRAPHPLIRRFVFRSTVRTIVLLLLV